jgi:hypothetical protein
VVYHAAGSSILHDSKASVYYGHRNVEWVLVKNMPGGLLAATLLPHLLYVLASFLYFSASGRLWDFCLAKLDAVKGMRRMLGRRRRIQRGRCVGNAYVWRLMEKELLVPRLMERLRRKRGSGA